jgi:hypothetical protein
MLNTGYETFLASLGKFRFRHEELKGNQQHLLNITVKFSVHILALNVSHLLYVVLYCFSCLIFLGPQKYCSRGRFPGSLLLYSELEARNLSCVLHPRWIMAEPDTAWKQQNVVLFLHQRQTCLG